MNTDKSGNFFFTILGAVIGGIMGAVDAISAGTSVIEGAINGAKSGGISGAGVDIAIVAVATGGASLSTGALIAGGFGALGSVVGVRSSYGEDASMIDYAASAIVGSMANMISFGTGPINGEIAKGALKDVVKELVQTGMDFLVENVVSGGIISFFTTMTIRATTNNYYSSEH
ncbi:MAG: hypothetical protein E7218_08195 [Anaerofustis stercorihominis]|nr:hypothetical protein [Anaerofustis stercorihominis]